MNKKIIPVLQLIMAAVFLASAVSKMLSPGIFEIILMDRGFADDREVAAFLSRGLFGFELALGCLLLIPHYLRRVTLPVTFVVLAAFSVYLLVLIVRGGKPDDCGCFGELVQMSPWASFFKNILLMGMTVYLFKNVPDLRSKPYLGGIVLAVSFVVVFAALPVRDVDDNVFAGITHFEPDRRVDLTDGEYVLGVFNATCEDCQAVAKSLGTYDSSGEKRPELLFLIWGESDEEIVEFFTLSSVRYPFARIDENLFFELIGDAPPRLYWLIDGEIRARWDEDFIEKLNAAFTSKKDL